MPILEGHKNVCLIEAMDVLTFAKTQTILQCANSCSVQGKMFCAHSASRTLGYPVFSINQLELSLYHNGTFKT